MSENLKARKQKLTELVRNETNFHTCDFFQRLPNSFVHLVFGYKDKAYTGQGFSCVLSGENAEELGSDLAFDDAVEDIVYQIVADDVKAFLSGESG